MATTEEYVAQGYPLEVAKELSANDRARAEGYESAAHKEAHANTKAGTAGVEGGAAARERAANERAKLVTDPRTGQKFQSASDMEAYANDEAVRAGFTSAVDQEIDANRRAREAGYLNAADRENPGPGGPIRVDPNKFPFVDPRDLPPEPIPPQFAIGTANDIKWNPDQPDHPDYDPNWRGGLLSSDVDLGTIKYPFLQSAGIGQNLAYKPWMPKAWSPDVDNNYQGIPGGDTVRDLMYYYGGTTPGRVPGGWKPVDPPGEGKAVYPISPTPLFPTGKMPSRTDQVVDDKVVDDQVVDTYGALLSNYVNRMGIAPAGTGNYMYRVTGDPYKVSGVSGGTGPDRAYDSYRVPLMMYGGAGGPEETFATRHSSAEGWDPSMNQWVTRGYDSGGAPVPGFNINFADWAGTPGAYTSTDLVPKYGVLGGLLADPQNVSVEDPTSRLATTVPWAAADYGGPSWLTAPQSSAFGTGPLANWGFNPIYGRADIQGDNYTQNLLGFGGPVYRSSWVDQDMPYGPGHPDWSGPD